MPLTGRDAGSVSLPACLFLVVDEPASQTDTQVALRNCLSSGKLGYNILSQHVASTTRSSACPDAGQV